MTQENSATWWRNAGLALLDFVYPPRCLLCGSVGAYVCGECSLAWPRAEPPFCPQCSDPLPLGPCPRCANGLAPLDAAGYAVVYDEGARDIVRHLKYEGKRQAVPAMAEAMAFVVRTHPALHGCDTITPISLHPYRLRQRGYNQSAWLAMELSSLLNLRYADTLERVRHTHPQVGLDAEARRRNMEGVFRANDNARGRRILLVDDVSTTGATARDAARALREAGAVSVRLLTFARDL